MCHFKPPPLGAFDICTEMYTVNRNSDEPIMLLNRQIGPSYHEDGTVNYSQPYIDGAAFQEELMELDSMGKKRIQVWINSPGGSIMHGMNIFNAILKSKTPCDTYNVGIAASIAGAVFMAGRKRVMCDYAQFMMHPVSGSEDGQADKAYTDSVSAMLAAKSSISTDTVKYMMATTSWLPASKCLENGICTEIEVTKEANKKYMPTDSVENMLAYSNNILNEHLKPNTMDLTKVANKLGLNPSASEDAILSAINSLEQARNEAQAEATAATTARDAAVAKVNELTEQLATAQTELDAANAATQEAQEAAALEAATNMVNTFKKRIGDKPEALEKWVNMAKADMDGTKLLLESLPINAKATNIHTPGDGNPSQTLTAQAVMAEVQNKTANK